MDIKYHRKSHQPEAAISIVFVVQAEPVTFSFHPGLFAPLFHLSGIFPLEIQIIVIHGQAGFLGFGPYRMYLPSCPHLVSSSLPTFQTLLGRQDVIPLRGGTFPVLHYFCTMSVPHMPTPLSPNLIFFLCHSSQNTFLQDKFCLDL